MNMMKRTLALVVGLVLATLGGLQPAQAGKTDLLKEFVGNVENDNRIGEGKPGKEPACDPGPCFPDNAEFLVAGRFANSVQTIAEGPPPGRSDPVNCTPADDPPGQNGCVEDFTQRFEEFIPEGASQVSERSPNGFRTWENTPTCRGDFGIRPGSPARYTWEIAIEETPVVGAEIQLQLCLDVRKCQRDDDKKGQAATPGEIALTVDRQLIGAVVISLVHEAGPFRLDKPFGNERDITNLVMPGLSEVSFPSAGRDRNGKILDIPGSADPEQSPFKDMLEESIEFIGKDCTVKWIKNDGMFVKQDRIRVQLAIPSSINVRVRAAQDSAAICYLALVEE